MAVAVATSHAVFYDTSGASDSKTVTVDAAADCFGAVGWMFNGTGDTITMTLGAKNPTQSFQTLVGSTLGWGASWVDTDLPASGSRTLALSGADSGDEWGGEWCNFTGADQTTPIFAHNVLAPGASTPDSIPVNTDSVDDLILAILDASANPSVTSPGVELDELHSGDYVNGQVRAGTGSSVSPGWTVSGTTYGMTAMTLLAASGGADDLTADDIADATSLSSPSIGQVHAISADDLAAATVLDQPAVGQEHTLLADDLASATTLSSPSVAIVDACHADDLASTTTLGQPIIGQIHALSADDLASAVVLSTPAATSSQSLLADDLASATSLGGPAIGQVHVIDADDLVLGLYDTANEHIITGDVRAQPRPGSIWIRVNAVSFKG